MTEESIESSTENFNFRITKPRLSKGEVMVYPEVSYKDNDQSAYGQDIKLTGRTVSEYAGTVLSVNKLTGTEAEDDYKEEIKGEILSHKKKLREIAEKRKAEGSEETDSGHTKKEKLIARIYQEKGDKVPIEEIEDDFDFDIWTIIENDDDILGPTGQKEVSLSFDYQDEAQRILGFDDFEGDPIKVANEKLEEDPLGYYLDSFNKIHKGDHCLKVWELVSALTCVCADRQIHSWAVGPSGKGKSHLKRRLLKFLPESSYKQITSLSPKALLYKSEKEGKDVLNGKLVFFDEVESLENVVPLLRSITDQDEDMISHEMVRDQQIVTLELEVDEITVWFTSVETIRDEQLKNRFILTNPDGSESLDDEVWKHQVEILHYGENLDLTPTEAPVIKEMIRMIRQDTKNKNTIIPFEIDWKQKFNRRLYPYFVTLMSMIAKIHYTDRQERDGNIFVTKADFELAALIWSSLIDTTVAQTDKESLKLLETLPETPGEAMSRRELALSLEGFSTNKVADRVEALQETEELSLINSKYDSGKYMYWAGEDRDKLVDNEPEIVISEEKTREMLAEAGYEEDEIVESVLNKEIEVYDRLQDQFESRLERERDRKREYRDTDEEELPEITEEEEEFLQAMKDMQWSSSVSDVGQMTDFEKPFKIVEDLEKKGVLRVSEGEDDGQLYVDPTSKYDELKKSGELQLHASA